MPRSSADSSALGRPTIFSPVRYRADQELRVLLESVIGLDVVRQALEIGVADEPLPPEPGTPAYRSWRPSKFRQMLERMQDTALTGNQTIVTLMQDTGVRFPELLQLIVKRNTSLAVVEHSAKVGHVIESVAHQAIMREEQCPDCKGEGAVTAYESPDHDAGEDPIEVPKVCTRCDGHGKIIIAGDINAQKLYLGIYGIVQKGGGAGGGAGTTVNVGVQQGVKIERADGTDDSEHISTRIERIIEQGG